MCSTFMGVNVIGETHNVFVVTGCVLHGYFNCDIIHLTVCVDWCIKDHILVLVDIFNVASNPTLIVVMFSLFETFTPICDGDSKASIQKG